MKSSFELVEAIRSSLPAAMEWTERDAMLLELARAQAADLDMLEGNGLAGSAVGRRARVS